MDKNTRKGKTKVLKFPKRRYDGGTEIELIKAIERKQKTTKFAEIKAQHMAMNQKNEKSMPIDPPKKQTKKQKLFQAIMMGPLEIAIGLVGLLTTVLAVFTFTQFKNEAMAEQSRNVFDECLKTLSKGWFDTLTMPNKLLKAAVS